MSDVIPIPAKSRERLEQLVLQRDAIGAQLDAIVLTLRDALDVPDTHTLTDVRVGFVPAPDPIEQPQP
jgi:hypothetical protein